MEDKYYKLYKKYKNKYLGLKIGGNHHINAILKGINGKLFLPCEITRYTKYLYISSTNNKKVLGGFSDIKSLIKPVLCSSYSGFLQDPFILFKDESNIDYGLKVGTFDKCSINPIKTNLKILDFNDLTNGNHFGGNYISAPSKKIFTLNNTYLHNKLSSYLEEPVTELKCSFTYNGERHIDELMTFMPYGVGQYKIWIYEIDKLEVENSSIPDISSTVAKFEQMKEFMIEKGRVFESTVGFGRTREKITVINIFTCLTNSEIMDHYNDFIIKSRMVRKLSKNGLLLSPMEINLLKFYFKLPEPKPNQGQLIELLNSEIEKKKIFFETERQNNLNIISNELFSGNYESNSDKFVSFPIDLKIKGYFSEDFIITNIPIFNRLLIETSDVKRFIFSVGKLGLDNRVEKILDREKPKIASYIDGGNFNYSYVDTSSFNMYENAVGGNMHCLVKNHYE